MIIVIKVDIRMLLEWENSSGKLQIISGKFQNNAINDVKQISLSHVINESINSPAMVKHWMAVIQKVIHKVNPG